jgi:glyoxylase-like metal-dependent hydrolase (beta-lactamase superfamily II)
VRSSDDTEVARPVEVVPGIYRLTVSTPFHTGSVNAYLLEGSPLTLIDGGPNLATGLVDLERMVRAAGHELADLELLLVTHQHVDHEGLTGLLAERSGAEVACLGQVADYVSAFDESQRADDQFAQTLMLRHGIDPHVVDSLASVASVLVGLGAPVPVTRRLEHGEVVEAGNRRLRVLHKPGHSPGDTAFHDESCGVLFSGDATRPASSVATAARVPTIAH